MPRHAQMLVAALVIALVCGATASGSRTLTGPGTIRVTSTLAKHTYVDLGVRGHGAGDVDFYRELIFNKRITPKSIGHSDVSCVSTGSGSTNCTGTYLLPKGKIVVGGVIGSHREYVLAVLGGTGLYENARGSLTVRPLTRTTSSVLFKLGV
jgi:hypothetical protein